MADSKEKLFSEFPPVSTQEWMDKVVADLKGADFEKKLVWKTDEGFRVKPFYRAEDVEGLTTTDSLPGEFPYVRGTKTNNDWFVRQDIEVTEPQSANKKALDRIKNGINSIGFKLSRNLIAPETMDILLDGINIEQIEINFKTCIRDAASAASVFAEYVKKKSINAARVKGSVNVDPFKRMLIKGFDVDNTLAHDIKTALDAASTLPNFRVLGANAFLFNNAGAYCAQELGFGLAHGNAFLALAQEAGLPVSEVAKKITFNFGVGSNYFMEIAKFRAARQLWAKIVAAYDEDSRKDAAKMYIHASTSEWNQTVYDAYVNMLRSQTETMSAAIAGVDSITVIPFDTAYQKPDEFSERIARNQQLLLKEESHFNQVVDASAGSYYIENLTASLAEEAWKIFLAVEDKGGYLTAIREGFVQQEVNNTGEKRLNSISSRREILLGTNQYPNFTEAALDKVADKTLKPEGKANSCNCDSKGTIPVLSFAHASSQFDTLRLATEQSGKRPKAFMLTIGSLSMRLARAQFACNFFACAGYEVIDNLGFETAEEGVQEARKAGADIIVICSSDEEYATLAPQAFEAIKGGKELFVVAGNPECTEELKAIGITNFIHIRSNVLQTLQGFSKQLGIL